MGDIGVARHAHVGALQAALARQQPATHEAGDHGHAQPVGQFRHAVLKAVAAHLHPHHQHRAAGGTQPGQHFRRAGGHGLFVAGRGRVRGHRAAGHGGHVARNLQVHRARMLKTIAQHPPDDGGRGGRVVQDALVAGDLLIHAELRAHGLHLMVQQEAARPLRRARRAGQNHQRRLFREGLGHGVQHVDGPGPVGDGGHAEPPADACGGVGREAEARLVGQGDQRQDAGLLDDLEIRQREVAGDAPDLARAAFLQGVQQCFGDVHACLPDMRCPAPVAAGMPGG